MKNAGQQVVICPNCGSNKVKITTAGASGCAGFGVGFLLICTGIWIPIIGWAVVMPLGAMIMILSLILPWFAKSASVSCQECDHKFKISKEKMKKYNKYVYKK